MVSIEVSRLDLKLEEKKKQHIPGDKPLLQGDPYIVHVDVLLTDSLIWIKLESRKSKYCSFLPVSAESFSSLMLPVLSPSLAVVAAASLTLLVFSVQPQVLLFAFVLPPDFPSSPSRLFLFSSSLAIPCVFVLAPSVLSQSYLFFCLQR